MSSNTPYTTGVGTVTGPNLNSFTQTVTTATVLRSFDGAVGMGVMLLGISTPGDGGAGLFYWSLGNYTDNNSTVIVPPASAGVGAWLKSTIS